MAGYAEKSASVEAHRLLRNASIQEAISKLLKRSGTLEPVAVERMARWSEGTVEPFLTESGDLDLATDYARARAYGAETLIKRAEDGLVAATGRDGIYRARELSSLYKWRAARLNPKDFGDVLDVNVAGTIEHKAVTHAPEWLQRAVRARRETIEHEPDSDN